MLRITSFAKLIVTSLFVSATAFTLMAQVPENDQVSKNYLSTARHQSGKVPPNNAFSQGPPHNPLFFDSILNFSGQFNANGFDSLNNIAKKWDFNMVGNRPEHGGTTVINAPIIPVSIDLRNADGSPRFVNGIRMISDATQFVQPVLDSPVFSNANYSSSSVPTQFTDAIQRAEFFDTATPDWHTLLNPTVKPAQTMTLLKGTYLFATNDDGTCCAFILVDEGTFINSFLPLFGSNPGSVVASAENAGDITTHDISTFLFPNTFLFFQGDLSSFTLGFHTVDFESGNAANGNLEKGFVINYSSWVSPFVFFSDNFQDVTALSHEVAETFNDPFAGTDGDHGITPWWLAPNGGCQNLMEVGDVVEDLPNATFPIATNGAVYHPQNEALLPWFEFQSPSHAIDGAYSYPDESLLPSLSPVQHAFCE
ncbi:MAG TPA: hypothetical protein VGK24_15130 [Candidatus Angelobacter sp.]|jgi:hypothetical protein